MSAPAFAASPTEPRQVGPAEAIHFPVELGLPGADVLHHTTLFDISQALSAAASLRDGVNRVLRILEQYHSLVRSAVTLLDEETGELYIEASNGVSQDGRLARYRIGEGITGRVVASGTPIVVPDVAREPLFLHRTGRRPDRPGEEVTFICVPILLDRQPVGALSVDLRRAPERDHDQVLKFLHVVCALLALALKSQRPIDAERRSLREENQHLRHELQERYALPNMVGTTGPMRDLMRLVAQVAPTGATVLLRGESGTGKELIAHAIHYHSPRAQRTFIKVNCAALPESLIESELFGHERGAFTGALSRRKGRFELADGGTILLDEIGELSLTTQAKLLRVLQERQFERLGGTETLSVDVRVLAATNKNLERAIAERTFREDLYYRLNVFPIFVPPLRERKPDVLLLADHFVEKFSAAHGKQIRRLTTPAIDMLVSYHWPGNVRELENVIERAVVVCDGQAIHAHHLSPTLQTAEVSGTGATGSLEAAVGTLETDLIQDALKTTRG
ncbi:MAG: sigma 54-interacting transcriptional regulator, partial [Gemmatimonadota bacterium]